VGQHGFGRAAADNDVVVHFSVSLMFVLPEVSAA
jgi:hypothetical protein